MYTETELSQTFTFEQLLQHSSDLDSTTKVKNFYSDQELFIGIKI